MGEDMDYGGASYWSTFSSTGYLLTTSLDGYLRLYNQKMKLLRKKKAPGGSEPYAAAFSPSGNRVAVGYGDSSAVDILDGTTLRPLFAADTSGVGNGNSLTTVAWSQDGSSLYAGGRYNDGNICPVCRWKNSGHGSRQEWPGTPNTIMDLHPLSNGGGLCLR